MFDDSSPVPPVRLPAHNVVGVQSTPNAEEPNICANLGGGRRDKTNPKPEQKPTLTKSPTATSHRSFTAHFPLALSSTTACEAFASASALWRLASWTETEKKRKKKEKIRERVLRGMETWRL